MHRHDPAAAQLVDREVVRGREEQGLDGVRAQRVARSEQEHAAIGFLHDAVDVAEAGKPGVQPRAEGRVVRLHFGGKPACVVGRRQGHGWQAH